MRITLRDVAVRYDSGLPSARTALTAVSLSVEKGECVGVIGPTGSGKTTLLEVMSGLSRPTSGTALLEPDESSNGLRGAVGLAYQFPESQFFEETVFDDVAFGPERQGLTGTEAKQRVEMALSRAGLSSDDFGSRNPLSLSAGEKRRAAIAGILALSRPFLLLDEPTAGLDPSTAERIRELVLNEVAAGSGVVVVTHDLGFVEAVVDRVIVLSEGSVLADRPAEAALSDAGLLVPLGLEPPPRYTLLRRLRESGHPELARIEAALALSDGPNERGGARAA